jgi:hypothetical protein
MSALATTEVAKYVKLDDALLDIIWHNMDSRSNFRVRRQQDVGPIEKILVQFGKVVASGVFDQVISVNASKFAFHVTFASERGEEEIMQQLANVGWIPKGGWGGPNDI